MAAEDGLDELIAALSSESARALAAALNVDASKFEELGTRKLQCVAPLAQACKKLRKGDSDSIELRMVDLGPTGVAVLALFLADNTSCTTLDLGWCKAGPLGATALGHTLSKNSQLKTLHFEGNGIKDEGALALVKGLDFNTALKHLTYNDDGVADANLLGDAGHEALARWGAKAREARLAAEARSILADYM